MPNIRKEYDLAGIQELFNVLELGIDASKSVRSCTRVGAGNENEEPRPLLVFMNSKEERDLVVNNSYKLAKLTNGWDAINVVADLTPIQRQEEQDMEKEARGKNINRSQEEASKNWVWKVIGKKGEKVLRRVTLYQDETVNQQTGEVSRQDSGRGGFQSHRGGMKRSAVEGASPTGGSRRVIQRLVQDPSRQQTTPVVQPVPITVEDRLREISSERVEQGRNRVTRRRIGGGGFGADLGRREIRE